VGKKKSGEGRGWLAGGGVREREGHKRLHKMKNTDKI
jgi:hypothetical protein